MELLKFNSLMRRIFNFQHLRLFQNLKYAGYCHSSLDTAPAQNDKVTYRSYTYFFGIALARYILAAATKYMP
jgi:hypothetical protein